MYRTQSNVDEREEAVFVTQKKFSLPFRLGKKTSVFLLESFFGLR